MAYGECFLCGRNGNGDPLDVHHIFGGAYRDKSERYGLKVLLCHERCHIFGKYAVHKNPEVMRQLREYGQREAMERFGWSVDEFRLEFGRNYLSDEQLEEIESVTAVHPSAFRVTADELPFW